MSEDRYRLVVLGSAKVGKTSIIRRYLYNEFSEKYKETIEDLHSREFRIQGVPLNLDILDTNFNFPDMRRININSASAFLLVFSVDDVTSFKEMSELWQEICERRTDLAALPVVVVGNKADLPTKKIYEATATAFTSRLSSNVRYLETSARTCLNIVEIFRTLLEVSGFPRCKAGGGSLDDVEDPRGDRNTALRRINTTRNRPMNREIYAAKEEKNVPSLDKQCSTPALSVPFISDLRRNRSFKAPRSARGEKNGDVDEGKLTRSSSLIRRTKHLSLKIRRNGDKHAEDLVQDDSDCNIQ